MLSNQKPNYDEIYKRNNMNKIKSTIKEKEVHCLPTQNTSNYDSKSSSNVSYKSRSNSTNEQSDTSYNTQTHSTERFTSQYMSPIHVIHKKFSNTAILMILLSLVAFVYLYNELKLNIYDPDNYTNDTSYYPNIPILDSLSPSSLQSDSDLNNSIDTLRFLNEYNSLKSEIKIMKDSMNAYISNELNTEKHEFLISQLDKLIVEYKHSYEQICEYKRVMQQYRERVAEYELLVEPLEAVDKLNEDYLNLFNQLDSLKKLGRLYDRNFKRLASDRQQLSSQHSLVSTEMLATQAQIQSLSAKKAELEQLMYSNNATLRTVDEELYRTFKDFQRTSEYILDQQQEYTKALNALIEVEHNLNDILQFTCEDWRVFESELNLHKLNSLKDNYAFMKKQQTISVAEYTQHMARVGREMEANLQILNDYEFRCHDYQSALKKEYDLRNTLESMMASSYKDIQRYEVHKQSLQSKMNQHRSRKTKIQNESQKQVYNHANHNLSYKTKVSKELLQTQISLRAELDSINQEIKTLENPVSSIQEVKRVMYQISQKKNDIVTEFDVKNGLLESKYNCDLHCFTDMYPNVKKELRKEIEKLKNVQYQIMQLKEHL